VNVRAEYGSGFEKQGFGVEKWLAKASQGEYHPENDRQQPEQSI